MKASTLISFMKGEDRDGLLKQEISEGVARMRSQMKRKKKGKKGTDLF